MKRFLIVLLVTVMMATIAGCGEAEQAQTGTSGSVETSSANDGAPSTESKSSETELLAQELERELYDLVGKYVNGKTTFQAAETEFYKILLKYDEAVQKEVIEVSGIEIFFLLGDDNTTDELILTLYDGLRFRVTGVYEESAASEGSEAKVSYEQEIILMMIAEDMAKQVAQNPSTVSFKSMYWLFERDGHTFWVQGTFKCSNLLGVVEEHTIKVMCVANSDYSKIQPKQVYLDGAKIA